MKSPPAASRPRTRHRWLTPVGYAALLWAVIMAPLLTWGLPSSRDDALLFGNDPPWPPERYQTDAALAERQARNAGADTDLNPIADRTQIIDLTADDARRAEILRRYRLYSRQPDEIIVFQALQRMHPRQLDFDPRLYQYGGGYLYLVAAALVGADALGLAHVTSDANTYLAHPEAFARFYVVARTLSLAFGALTLIAAWKLARRCAGRRAGWLAFLAIALSPVFITAVCEAKPHLPSACLILWAGLSALDFRRRARWRDAIRLGLQAGYAFGLVLTGLLALVLWPVLFALARPAARGPAARKLAVAAAIFIAVYALTNPYVFYHALADGQALSSNIGNSTAMYANQIQRAADGAVRVASLLLESLGPGLLLAALTAIIVFAWRAPRRTLLLAAPALAFIVLGVLLGAGKPAEFARFLLVPVMLLVIAAAAFLAQVTRRHIVLGLIGVIATLGLVPTYAYVRGLAIDAHNVNESRHTAARYLLAQLASDDAVAVVQEPAPYSIPPFDFARRRIILLPTTQPPDFDPQQLPPWLVLTADDDRTHAAAWWQPYYQLDRRFPPPPQRPTPITWANKQVYIYHRAPAASAPSAPAAP